MAIRKISQTPPTMASIVDTYSTSEQDGYACDYINKLNTYSTNEIRVGTWKDGKPIYRKVITDTTSSSRDDKVFSAITNMETCVNITGILIDNNYRILMPSWGSSSNWINLAINDNNQPYCGYTSQYRSKDVTIIVEYTKTTD